MDFVFRALDRHGALVRGTVSGENLSDASQRLLRRQLEPLRLRRHRGFSKRLRRRQLIDFCVQLQQLIGAGIPLLEALQELRDAARGRLRDVLDKLLDDIQGGASFAQAMATQPTAFPRLATALVQAGEYAGCLPEILERYALSLRWQDELAAQNQRLLIYPAFVAATVLAAALFLMLNLVPQLRQFAARSGQELPGHARLLFASADALLANWPWLLALTTSALITFMLARQSSPRFRLVVDAMSLRVPVIGELERRLLLARFADHFALLYTAGIPVLDALVLLRPSLNNQAVAAALAHCETDIRQGRSLSEAFAGKRLFSGLVVRMLRVGEQTGAIDQALRHAANHYRQAVQDAAARLQAMIEPTLTLCLGLLLGWIMLAVVGPLYDFVGRTP